MKIRNFSICINLVVLSVIFSACSDSTVDPGRGGMTVNGKIFTSDGGGATGLFVRIGDAEVQTDANGSFSISDVSSPYDLIVVDPSDFINIYKGLTLTEPRLNVFNSGSPGNFTTISVRLPRSIAFNQEARFYFKEEDGRIGPVAWSAQIDSNTYNFYLRWNDEPVMKGNMYMLVNTHDFTNVVSYDMFYRRDNLELHAGQTITLAPLASEFTNPGETTFTGTVEQAPGTSFNISSNFDISFRSTGLLLDQNLPLQASGASYSLKIPTGLSVPFRVLYTILGSAPPSYMFIKGVASPTENIRMGSGPQLLSPPYNAGISILTPFEWTAGEGTGIYEFQVLSSGPRWSIFTTSLTETLPNINLHSTYFVQGNEYKWTVIKLKDYNSVNEYARDPYYQKSNGQFAAPNRNFIYSQSP